MLQKNETIVALATPNGVGALAVIRISGKDSFKIFHGCIKEVKKFNSINEREIAVLTFVDNKEVIDQITAIKYKDPKSFTGEDMVEIICHGGIITVKEIIRVIIKNGARLAHRGEFTRRAFENGKIDLLRAEAIRGIIESTSTIENRNALKAYYGKSHEYIEEIKSKIIEILCDIESDIEFNEEDDIKEKEKNSKILEIKEELEKELKRRKNIKEIEEGIKIVIAGPPNAGKSTLNNKILGYRRSIVNDKPGTTRDVIKETIEIKNHITTIVDSAGIRETEDEIEKEGIKKSEEEIRLSSITIWITSADEKFCLGEEKRIIELKNIKRTIFVLNKIDKKENREKEAFFRDEKIKVIKVSLIENEIDEIQNEIVKKVEEIIHEYETTECIVNERQEEIISRVYEKILYGIEKLEQKEIVSIYMNEALKEIENLTGKISNQEILDNIFDKFCIGK